MAHKAQMTHDWLLLKIAMKLSLYKITLYAKQRLTTHLFGNLDSRRYWLSSSNLIFGLYHGEDQRVKRPLDSLMKAIQGDLALA